MSQSQESSSPIKIGGVELMTTNEELIEIIEYIEKIGPDEPDFSLLGVEQKERHEEDGDLFAGILIGAELYRRRKEEKDKGDAK